ncbi:MAG: 30S ribosomal protein S18 [Dehalococcoidia bacterium]
MVQDSQDARERDGGPDDGGGEGFRDRGERGERPRRGGGGMRRRGCEFCIDKVNEVDYKDLDLLRRYVGDRGKIEARRKAGVCARHQRVVAQAIKRARHIALLPFTAEHIRVSGVLSGRR